MAGQNTAGFFFIDAIVTLNNQATDDVKLVQRLTEIGVALSQERDIPHLLEKILLEAKSIANAEGGTLYFLRDDSRLEFAIVRNEKLGICYGGDAPEQAPIADIALYDENGQPRLATQSVYSVVKKTPINIPDAYLADDFDFEGTKHFDKEHNYRTCSVLTIPLVNHKDEALGCLQLVNAVDPVTDKIVPFSERMQQIVHSLASQAAITLDNAQLIASQKQLLESVIRMIAQAIDRKSPYTGAHCERLPMIMDMMVDAACRAKEGVFKNFALTDDERYEIHIASWLHDCGKIVTPVHVMDKSTKLETIFDRIELVKTRWEVLRRDAKIAYLEAVAQPGADKPALESAYRQELAQLDEELALVQRVNVGGESMEEADIQRLQAIAMRHWQIGGETQPLLTKDEIYNLSVRKGTMTPEERQVMNDHMVVTLEMLGAMPFPRHLRNVPEIACGHHERMDGKGYPRGLKAGEMSIPARMMCVADVFEALTADDRPYKPGKKLSETMHIIGEMKRHNHLDPVMVDFFVTSGVYRDYARMFLSESLLDDVDEEALLAIKPLPMGS